MSLSRIALYGALLLLAGAPLTWLWLRGFRGLYPGAWSRLAVRRAAYAFVGAWGVAVISQPFVRLLEAPAYVRLPVSAVAGIGLVLLVLTTPFLLLGRWMRRRAEASPVVVPEVVSDDPSPRFSRRELTIGTARVLPLAGAGVAAMGAHGGADNVHVMEVEMAFPELPAALEGLRILQYSDVHLGHFIDMDEIAILVAQGQKARADLVVLTGDIADDLGQLPRALGLFESIQPRHGVYASIGNHEYFRGIRETRRAYDQSQVRLLLERGQRIAVGDSTLYLSGADDPRHLGRQSSDFFARTVDSTLDGAPSGAFHVLMSHRPEGFVAARKVGVQLTLSGHTHGAQVGIGGRSILEAVLPDKYLWGPYAEGGSRLYTSSGAGHWFPLRLGCPRELPVIKLVRGPADAVARKRRIA